jgi:2-methylaconitate cis-trans-isomerase PrpF
VLGAVSVATACLIEGSPAADVAKIPEGSRKTLSVEHPTGEMSCVLEVDDAGEVQRRAAAHRPQADGWNRLCLMLRQAQHERGDAETMS